MAKRASHFFLSMGKTTPSAHSFLCRNGQMHQDRCGRSIGSLDMGIGEVRPVRPSRRWLTFAAGLLAAALLCTLPPVPRALALPPAHVIEARNLQANLILIGLVTGTGRVLIPEKSSGFQPLKGLFVLKVLHVIKGTGKIRKGEEVRVAYRLSPPAGTELKAMTPGRLKVHVLPGDLVLVYLEPWETPEGFYRPLAAGASVVVIEHQEKNQGGAEDGTPLETGSRNSG